MSKLSGVLGPRTPEDIPAEEKTKYRLPAILLIAAALLLIISLFLPYWEMTLLAPQYPGGLTVEVYVNRMEGDVFEIDGLNHYIGMRPLEEAAQLERSVSIAAIIILALLLLAAVTIHSKWSLLLALPAIVMPFLFLGDMYFWLNNFGQNLDPPILQIFFAEACFRLPGCLRQVFLQFQHHLPAENYRGHVMVECGRFNLQDLFSVAVPFFCPFIGVFKAVFIATCATVSYKIREA